LKTTRSGISVCNFSIASNRFRKKGDEFEKETSFFDVQCWDGQALYVNDCCHKGTSVEVKGRLKQERWEDQYGQNRSKIIKKVKRQDLLNLMTMNGGTKTLATGARFKEVL